MGAAAILGVCLCQRWHGRTRKQPPAGGRCADEGARARADVPTRWTFTGGDRAACERGEKGGADGGECADFGEIVSRLVFRHSLSLVSRTPTRLRPTPRACLVPQNSTLRVAHTRVRAPLHAHKHTKMAGRFSQLLRSMKPPTPAAPGSDSVSVVVCGIGVGVGERREGRRGESGALRQQRRGVEPANARSVSCCLRARARWHAGSVRVKQTHLHTITVDRTLEPRGAAASTHPEKN